jgi:hypothetical protein
MKQETHASTDARHFNAESTSLSNYLWYINKTPQGSQA